MIPLINGITYTYANIILNILGLPIAGVTAIEYSDDQDMEDNYGAGIYPVNRGFGQYKAEGKVTLYMEEVEALTNAAPGRRLQNIPEFDIVVAYVNASNVPVTHKIRNVRFKNNNRKTKTGDKKIEIELDILTSHIDW